MTRPEGTPPRPGFWSGMGHFFAGFGFVASSPRVWPLAAVPVLVALVLWGGLGAAGVWGAGRLVEGWFGAPTGFWASAGVSVLRWALYAVAVLLALLAAFSLAQPLSGPALDDLARAQEIALGGARRPDTPWLPGVFRSLRVTLASLAVTVPILVVLFAVDIVVPAAVVVTVPLGVAVSAMKLSWDFVDYPFGLRGVGVRGRVAWWRRNAGAAFGFGLGPALVLFFVPCLALFVLPAGVAGAARLLFRTDEADAERALPPGRERAGGP